MESTNQERVEKIEAMLTEALAPSSLVVLDQSHLHAGHPGARDGRGHFDVIIVADAFAGKNMITRHRMIYEALGNMMTTDIHALSITAEAPEQ